MSTTPTSTPPSLQAGDSPSSISSAPRLSHDVVALLKESISQMVAHQAATDSNSAPPRRASQARAPQCTHIAMARLYGTYTCMLCHRTPELGFVYVCEQDHLQEIRRTSTQFHPSPPVSDHGILFEAQAEVARSLGMNHSIVTQIRAGEYNKKQVDILLAQRQSVKDAIAQAERSLSTRPPTSSKNLMRKLSASTHSSNSGKSNGVTPIDSGPSTQPSVRKTSPGGAPSRIPISTKSKPAETKLTTPKCNFKVCHACRPFFKDRVPTSFEAVFNDEVISGSFNLPIMNATRVRNLGLRPAALSKDERSNGVKVEAESEEPSDESVMSSSSSDESENPNQIDPYPCPGALICPLYTPNTGCAYDSGFDDGKKAINHGFEPADSNGHPTPAPSTTPEDSPYTTIALNSSLGASPSNTSSISLPDPIMEPRTPSKPYFSSQFSVGQLHGNMATTTNVSGRSASRQGYALPPYSLLGKRSNSSMGGEIEVDGGVALTEEAVETGIPDILTDAE